MMAVTPKTGSGAGSFSIDSIMRRGSPGAETGHHPMVSQAPLLHTPHDLLAASAAHSAHSDITSLRSSLHNHLLAQETALLNGSKPMYSQSLAAAAAGASGLNGLHLHGNSLLGLDNHPGLVPSGFTSLPGLSEHGLSALHALHAKSLAGPLGFGHSAAASAAALTLPKSPFHMYSWLSARPGYFGHRLPGSEPSFLLPFRKPKRIRTAFSPSQLLRLEHAFEKNHYVVGQERKDLAASLSLSETQVKVWFQNRRTKHKRVQTEEEMEQRQKHHDQAKRKPEEEQEMEEEEDDEDQIDPA